MMENNSVIKRLLIPKGMVPLFPLLDTLSAVRNGPEVGDEDVSDD